MTEPQEVLLKAAKDALHDASITLRQRGWPVELLVDFDPKTRSYVVSLRVPLPSMPVPVEAKLVNEKKTVWVVQDWKDYEGNVDSTWTSGAAAKKRASEVGKHTSVIQRELDSTCGGGTDGTV